MDHRANESASASIGHPGTETAYQKMKREADALNFSVRVDPDELWWCNPHNRWASHVRVRDQWHHCGPGLGGIMIPCSCVNLTDLVEVVDC